MESDLRDIYRDSRPRSPAAERDVRRGTRRARPRPGILASGRGDRSERPFRREARGPGEPPECLPNLDLRVRRDRHVAVDASGRADDWGRAVPSVHAVLRTAPAAAREHHRTTRTLTRLPGGGERAHASTDQALAPELPRGAATAPRLPPTLA